MKFVHLADVHLDMIFTSIKNNRELINKRRLEQKQIFKDAIDLTKKEKAEFLFISGDLFEQKYVQDETIEYIISCFKQIPDVHIFIAPGNHDPLIKNSPYNTYEWPENVIIFGEEIGKYDFEDVTIYGIGFENYEMESNAISDFKVEDESKVNILVTHGTLDGAGHKYHDIKTKDLSSFDYVALGHIHQKKMDDSKIIYPGSLVAGGFDEPLEHGLVIGEILKDYLKLKFKKMDYREFKELEIDISECQNINEAVEKIKLGEDIYKISITGIRHIDVGELIKYIKGTGKYISEVIDKSYVGYDLEEIAKQNNLKGIFTKNMLDILNENLEKKEEIQNAIDVVYKNL